MKRYSVVTISAFVLLASIVFAATLVVGDDMEGDVLSRWDQLTGNYPDCFFSGGFRAVTSPDDGSQALQVYTDYVAGGSCSSCGGHFARKQFDFDTNHSTLNTTVTFYAKGSGFGRFHFEWFEIWYYSGGELVDVLNISGWGGRPRVGYCLSQGTNYNYCNPVWMKWIGNSRTNNKSMAYLGDHKFDRIDIMGKTWTCFTDADSKLILDNIVIEIDYIPPIPELEADVDIKPDVLNLQGNGLIMTAFIELPSGYNVSDINISTILLEEQIPAYLSPTNINDSDSDGIEDLMVKFNRTALEEIVPLGNVTLTITGDGNDNEFTFVGNDTISVVQIP